MRSPATVRGSRAFSPWVMIVGILALFLVPFQTVLGNNATTQRSTVSISGSVTYYLGNHPVDSVRLILSGAASDTALTDAEGQYQFSGLETGLDYVVTSERERDDSPVTALDASLILRYLVGATELDGLQLISGDVSDNGEPTAFDAGIIMRYVVNNGDLPHHFIGSWYVAPDSLFYHSLFTDRMGQDYRGLIIGDVSGSWRQQAIATDTVAIWLPELSAFPGEHIRICVNTGEVRGLDVLSAQVAFAYDESILEVTGVSHEETFCGFWGVLAYSIHKGEISLAWSGMEPLEGDGPMVYIDFEVLPNAEIGQSIPLHFEYFMFNEGNPFAATKDGAISIISAPDILVSDTAHNFGQVAIGRTKDWKLRISNEGIENLVVTEILTTHIAFTVDETTFSVSPDSSLELTVTFAPLDEGLYEGILTVLSNDPDKSECIISATGVGVRSDPDISVSHTSCDFGQVAVHGVAEAELTVSNVGTETLVVTDIDATNPDFSVDKTVFTLQPDSSEQVTVTCSPSAERAVTGNLVVFSNDPDESVVTIDLSAVGVTPDVTMSVSGASGNPGTSGTKVLVLLDNRSDVAGMELVVNFDPDVLTATGISTTSRSAHIPIFIANVNYGSGKAKLLLAATGGESIAHGAGSVAEILFDIDVAASLGTYPVTLSDVIMGDAKGNSLLTGIENGSVNITGSTGVEESHQSLSVPEEFTLLQNGPNPFNPTTDIRYQIPDVGYSIHTSMKVYNLLGQELRSLVDDVKGPGYYSVQWDGRDDLGNEVPSGIYFYRLTAGEFSQTRRMIVLQ